MLAGTNDLPDAILTDSGLKITPLDASVPQAAQRLIDQVAASLPHIKITDLLLEVDTWTGYTAHFTHLKSGDAANDRIPLLTAILADAINMGLSVLQGDFLECFGLGRFDRIVMNPPFADGVRADVAVMLYGDDLGVLVEKAGEIARLASTLEGTQDTRVDRVGGQQYLTVDIDRKSIARHGLNASDVNDVVETAIAGKSATEIYEGERRFQAIVRLPTLLRDSIEDVRELQISAPNGESVPLKELASVKVGEGPALINRSMGKRRIVVGVNVQGRDLGGFVAELQDRVDKRVKLPPGYLIEWGGQFQNMQRAMHHLMIIVPITVAAIFFLLFVLFGSVRFAALIITVLPLASIGGVLGLFLTGEYLSVPASVGFIALWGIAVLNGVVLVSYIRKLRQEGMGQDEAVREGAALRFRPVMMTATVAALGLVPFLFATGPGSEIQRPLAIVVIGGLVSSTALTLLLVPALYAFFEGREEVVVSDHA